MRLSLNTTRFALCAALLAGSAALSARAQQAAAPAELKVADRLRKAEELLKAGLTNDAWAAYERAVDAAPRSAAERRAARFAYAQALTSAGRHDAAAAQYRAAIDEGGGRDAIAHFNLGNAHARAGANEQAAAAYRTAIAQRYGRYSRARNNLGLVLARLGRLDEAREEYERAVAEEGGHYADAHYNLALLHWRRGEDKEAEKHLVKARRGNPNHEDAAILLAQITSGNKPEDVNPAETVVTVTPAATSDQRAEKPAEAVDKPVAVDESVDKAVDKPAREAAKLHAPLTGRAAAAPAERALSLPQPLPPAPKTAPPQPPSVVSNPTQPGASVSVSPAAFRQLQQAREARRGGNLEQAATLYRSALQSAGRDVAPIQWEYAEVLMRLDRPGEAAELYRRVIMQAGARYPSAYYNLGRAMMGEGKHAGAVVMLRQALTRLGEQSYIYLALSEALERSENINGALEALNKYAALREKERDDADEKEWYERKLASLREKLR
jgi:tetratricopeptide (TPR) repeat protein